MVVVPGFFSIVMLVFGGISFDAHVFQDPGNSSRDRTFIPKGWGSVTNKPKTRPQTRRRKPGTWRIIPGFAPLISKP